MTIITCSPITEKISYPPKTKQYRKNTLRFKILCQDLLQPIVLKPCSNLFLRVLKQLEKTYLGFHPDFNVGDAKAN